MNERIRAIAEDHCDTALKIDGELDGLSVGGLTALVRWFEALVPIPKGPSKQRNPDAVFTPGWVCDLMVGETITAGRRHGRVVDPSCGCGALLVAAFERIWDLHPDSQSPALTKYIIEQQLFGRDVNPESVRRGELLLSLAAIEVGGDNPSYDFAHLACGNSLDLSSWGEERFDVVVGNPPYIRYQQLSEDERELYRSRFQVLSTGNFNLYYPFFELADHLCTDVGVIAYITPNAYFRAASARPLRRWMVSKFLPTKIVDFGSSQVFDEVSTYTALTFSERGCGPTGVLGYGEAYDGDDGNKPLHEMPSADKFSSVPLSELGGSGEPWNLVGKETYVQLRRIRRGGGRPLEELADIRFGCATLRDNLFLLTGEKNTDGLYTKEYAGTTYLVEPQATMAAVKVPDVSSAAELQNHRGRVIFPYTHDEAGRAVIWTSSELGCFPEAKKYLDAIRSELAKRDNGNKTYAAWYAYGRTQGLTKWTGQRLLTPLHAAAPRFILDSSSEDAGGRLFFNGCSITPKDGSGVSVALLLALLNSTTLQFYIEQVGAPLAGGYYPYQKGPLGKFQVHDEILRRGDEVEKAAGSNRNELIRGIYGVEFPERYR